MPMSMRCLRSRLIIDAQTSSRLAQLNSGNGQWRATFGSVGDPAEAVLDVELEPASLGPEGEALRWLT